MAATALAASFRPRTHDKRWLNKTRSESSHPPARTDIWNVPDDIEDDVQDAILGLEFPFIVANYSDYYSDLIPLMETQVSDLYQDQFGGVMNITEPSDWLAETSSRAGLLLGHNGLTSAIRAATAVVRGSQQHYLIKTTRRLGRLFDSTPAIIRELGRIADGWFGEGSLGPNLTCLSDIQTVLAIAPRNLAAPDAEIDPDTGGVILRWQSDAASFSLTINGNGHVTGFLLNGSDHSPAWRLKVTDVAALSRKLRLPEVQALITT